MFEKFCLLNDIKYKKAEQMQKHTSFKIGGPADFFIEPKNTDELCLLVKHLKENEIPFFIIGKGSNLLVSDEGIEGVVISLALFDNVSVNEKEITAEAGASLTAVCLSALNNSLKGLEFAYGIPGSVGGALFMNAGAYGGEMSHVVKSAEYVTDEGETGTILAEDMKLGYRTSIFKDGKKIITSVTFDLEDGEPKDIKGNMDDYMSRRKLKQPLEYPSAGSTFKRPEGNFAGALIEKNNLKKVSVGGAMVSEKHAGFIINYNNATCEDVKGLISVVKNKVLEADGIELEPEVILVGRGI